MEPVSTVTEKGGVAVTEGAAWEDRMVAFNVRAVGNRGKPAAAGERSTTQTGVSLDEVRERVLELVEPFVGAISSPMESVRSVAVEAVGQIACLIAHRRDIRSGAGERSIALVGLLTIAEAGLASTVAAMLPVFVAEYGSFRDLNALAVMLTQRGCTWPVDDAAVAAERDGEGADGGGGTAWMRVVRDAIVGTYVSTLSEDRAILAAHSASTGGGDDDSVPDGGAAAAGGAGGGGTATSTMAGAGEADRADAPERPKLSLAGKWAPRHGKAHDRATGGGLRKMITARLLGGCGPAQAKAYRQLCARLSDALEVVERRMEQHRWRDIHPSRVPGLASKRHARALRNLPKGKGKADARGAGGRRAKRRRTDDADRIACARRIEGALDAVLSGKTTTSLKADALDPVTLLSDYFDGTSVQAAAPDKDIEARWAAMVASVRRSNEEGQGMPPCIPLIDVSGSMRGLPMQAAVALGILLAEVAPAPYNNVCLPFSHEPTWVHLRSTRNGVPFRTLLERVKTVVDAPWGYSTNFGAALNLVLRRAVRRHLPADTFANTHIVVLTDMQYDAAECGPKGYGAGYRDEGARHSTEAARRAFTEAGYEPPTIVCWNLRADTRPDAMPATSRTEGVVEISGYSQAMVKTLLSGGDLAEAGTDEQECQAGEAAGAVAAAVEAAAAAGEEAEEAKVAVVAAADDDADDPAEPVDSDSDTDGSDSDGDSDSEGEHPVAEAVVAPDGGAEVAAGGEARPTPWSRLRRTLVSVRYEPVRRAVR
eukprot:CAMPEP_0203809536 /NCGR_PEP_ID=MMETSP0115-20131106/2346_1 /ASSEMBLY_ACC=CAM_ASM_000227 /TAXON_ID=33651 /ORGANISM="Bicosoecid sp, Strain ms1" /LENGTH=766 /DNA_ID=CAMNT_0050718273 /DNA_START=47 /DNA_END=2344 /DNA_ORIENTATION=-